MYLYFILERNVVFERNLKLHLLRNSLCTLHPGISLHARDEERKGSAPLKRELVPAAGLKDGHHLGPQVEAPSWTDSLEVFIGHSFSQGSCMPVLSPQGYFSWPLQCFKTVGLVYQYFKIKS